MKDKFNVWLTFHLSSENAFNLDKADMFSSGKDLTHSLIHHFEAVQNSNKLHTTTEMSLLKDFKIQIP